MKKLMLTVVMLICCQVSAHAVYDIDVDYTGKTYSKFADTITFPSNTNMDPSYLGGYPARNSKEIHARQFTVPELSTANYLSINAGVTPNIWDHDTALSAFISQLREQGATPEEIGAAIPGFVSPPQNITVDFLLIRGSVPRIVDLPTYTPLPSANIISKTSYTFYTDDGLHTKQYNNLLVPLSPFDPVLEPEQDYWIYATTPTLSNVRINYSTGLVGTVNTPEPATLLLMGGGLAGLIWRRRKKV